MEIKETMMDYILETPKAVLANLERAEELTKPLVDLYLRKDYRNIVLVASGSSCTSCNCARLYLAETLHTDVKIVTPYNFAHHDYKLLREDDFCVLVSQSGASTNGVEVLKKLKAINHESISLTGNEDCDFKDYSDYLLDWGVGIETVGYVTKGVETLTEYLMMFATYAAKAKGFIKAERVDEVKAQIAQAMDMHKEVRDQAEAFFKSHMKDMTSMSKVYVCGCGTNYGTAMEGALKVGEAVKIPSMCYELDEVLHGPALQLDPAYTVFLIDSGDETSKHAVDLYHAMSYITDHIYILTNDKSVDDAHAIRVSKPCEEPFTCFYYLPFFQSIAHYSADALDSWDKHPLYFEMNKRVDFRTPKFREKVSPR